MRQRGTDTWKTLQHVKLARSQTLGLPVIPLENAIVRRAELICETAHDPERVFGIARIEDRSRHMTAKDTIAPLSACGWTSGMRAGRGPSIRMIGR